ncbi:hypothetical protein C5167_015158 [Papaver somniferum]|uniref:Uncharacterized protein n=1 Tax=Papaver somniferum TaxID=3469 RepID=A0A4Y7J751_PAPSO|nr:hypothetical protein C5167_015158 [Papaver somniferum]
MITRCDQGITGKQMTRTRSASHDKWRLKCKFFLMPRKLIKDPWQETECVEGVDGFRPWALLGWQWIHILAVGARW